MTDGWFLWVMSEVVPDCPARETEKNIYTVKQEGSYIHY